MRLAYYAGASTAAAVACLLYAFEQRPNFYSAAVYLSSSNACILILTNLLLVLTCSLMYALQRLLYGPLRPIEIEQLSEKAWYAVLDTLLAMPSFREDVGGWLLAMFTLLLAGKVWGWIGEGRVDILEQQPPANPKLFHIRLATSLIVSVIFDMLMLRYCVQTVVDDPRPGMMVIFTFEFAILTVFSYFTLARYLLTVINAKIEKEQMQKAIEERQTEIRAERAAARQNETEGGQPAPASPPNEEPIEVDENEVDVPGWEEKRRYLFGLEVFTDFVKLIIYLVFFTVSITFNGLPMHIMRDVYMTFASFSKRVADYVAYRKATSDMNTRYPDATTEEIRGDACIVCRESMVAWEQPGAQGQAAPAGEQPAAAPTPARRRDEGLRAKKLPCGHILHLRCLKAWLERQQVCPTCRRPVVTAPEPGAAGLPGVHGGAPGLPAQQGQQRQQRQGRARILNLGPVRIGFLNGPGDQIGNIIRQMQNGGQQPAAQNAAQQPANQPGPNHLGLQVPYADGGAQIPTEAAQTTNGPRATVPTQVQLMQIEQRLIQDAHNLGIEQQQLYTLRMMEAELARLRAQYQPAQNPVGITGNNALGPVRPVHIPPVPGMHMPMPNTGTMPEQWTGNQGQQHGSGHEHLPQGMVLPEGWTVMPLQRANALPNAQMAAQPNIAQAAGGQFTGAEQIGTSGATAPTTSVNGATYQPPTTSQPTSAPDMPAGENSAGPTDERGSPLFVPAATPAPSSDPPEPLPSVHGPTEPPTVNGQKAPWNADSGWSFVDQPNNAAEGPSSTATVTTQGNGHPPESAEPSSGDKGKGKAVQVEDAPDEGS